MALPLALVLASTVVLGGVNAANAAALAPTWGQDLAFFTQIVHRAAHGGPWASPLLLEPQGFFEMVHTHLVLPLIVGAYALTGRQEALLYGQAAFTSLALWPAFRLGERGGGLLGGLLAALGVALFGPFQAVAIADFRPSALFLPGVMGMYAAARDDRWRQAMAWALVANLGRQEGAWLAGVVGVSLLLAPWGLGRRPRGRPLRRWLLAGWRWRTGLALCLFGAAALGLWVAVKPQFFFHLNPLNPAPPPALAPEIAAARVTWLGAVLRSGGVLGLLAPAPLLGGAPVFREMALTAREWGPLTGPSAHYGAFWVPFVLSAGIAGAARLRGALGLTGFAALCALSFPWVTLREGPTALWPLIQQVEPGQRVAASYDVISALGGREVVWNSAWLSMAEDDRPHGWAGTWPIPLSAVDVLLIEEHDPLLPIAMAEGWERLDAADDHVLLGPPQPR